MRPPPDPVTNPPTLPEPRADVPIRCIEPARDAIEPVRDGIEGVRAADVFRAYRSLGGPAVPQELDRTVLRHARRALASPARARPRRFIIAGVAMLGALGTAIAVLERDTRRIGPVLQYLPVISSGANGGRLQSQQLYSSDPLARKDPRRWLAEIAALRSAGRHAEADTAYREYLAAYPRPDHRPAAAASEW
jgi:hypothetical protein